jgi:hypothetical protein
MWIDENTSLRVAMLIADDLKLARAVSLDTMFDPRESGVQLFEERPLSCPFQCDHDGSMRKRGLRPQESGTRVV